jgi:hypothetical protein
MIRLQIDFEAATNATASVSDLRRELDGLEADVTATASASAEASVKIEGVSASIDKTKVAAVAAIAAIAGVTMALRAVANASIEGEKDFTRLDGALRGAGATFDSTDASIQRFFSSLQATTRFSGGEAAQAMAVITRRTRDYALSQDQLVAVTQLSADVAERMGMTIDQASERVIKALEGESRAMRELGASGEDADEIFASLAQRFGGAAAEINGLEQAQARLTNAKDDLIRIAGRLITSNDALITTTRNAARIVEVFTAVIAGGSAETDRLRRNLQAILPSVQASGGSLDLMTSVVVGLVDAVTVGINTLRAFQIAIEVLTGVVRTQASVVLILGTSLLDGLMIPVQVVTRGLQALSEDLARLFDLIPGMDGMAERARRTGASWDSLNASAGQARETLQGMRRELVGDLIPGIERAATNVIDIAEAMAGATRNADAFREGFRSLVEQFDFSEDGAIVLPVGLVFDPEATSTAREAVMDAAESLEVDKGRMTLAIVEQTLREEERLRREAARRAEQLEQARLQVIDRSRQLEFQLLDRTEQQRRILAQMSAEFEISSFEDRARVFGAIEEQRIALAQATTVEEARQIDARLELLRQFAAEADRIDAEAARAREERARRLAGVVTSASMAMGTALGNIFAGADPGEEFSAAVRRLIGNMLIAQGTQITITGAAQLIPGPMFNPVAGAANLALGASATIAGAALGATAGAPSIPTASPAIAPPLPPSTPSMQGGPVGDTFILQANESIITNPVAATEDLRRLERQGARSGVRQGRSAA